MRYPRNSLVLLLTLVAFPASGVLCQRGADLQVGLQARVRLAQVNSAGSPTAPQLRRDVPWQTGAVVGFAAGVIAGFALQRGGDEASSGVAIYLGLLGALVGALGQALFSSGFAVGASL